MRIGRIQIVLIAVFGLGAAACAGILGIEDRSLDPETEDASASEGGPSCPTRASWRRTSTTRFS